MKKIILAILLFFALIYWILTAYFSDVIINKYPDKESVVKEKVIEKGWIPALLPDSAYNIEETHDLDTNQLFGRFSYKPADENVLMHALKPYNDSNNTYRWEKFLFKVDTKTHTVKFRNLPGTPLSKHNNTEKEN